MVSMVHHRRDQNRFAHKAMSNMEILCIVVVHHIGCLFTIRVYACAEEGSGAWILAAGANQEWISTSDVLGIRHVGGHLWWERVWLCRIRHSHCRRCRLEWLVVHGVHTKVGADAWKGLAGAQDGIYCCCMADLFSWTVFFCGHWMSGWPMWCDWCPTRKTSMLADFNVCDL